MKNNPDILSMFEQLEAHVKNLAIVLEAHVKNLAIVEATFLHTLLANKIPLELAEKLVIDFNVAMWSSFSRKGSDNE